MERKLNGLTRYVSLVFLICVLSTIGLIASHLALVDIYHGVEPDLSMEWNMLRIGFGLQIILVVTVLGLLWRVTRLSGVRGGE